MSEHRRAQPVCATPRGELVDPDGREHIPSAHGPVVLVAGIHVRAIESARGLSQPILAGARAAGRCEHVEHMPHGLVVVLILTKTVLRHLSLLVVQTPAALVVCCPRSIGALSAGHHLREVVAHPISTIQLSQSFRLMGGIEAILPGGSLCIRTAPSKLIEGVEPGAAGQSGPEKAPLETRIKKGAPGPGSVFQFCCIGCLAQFFRGQ
mmetsp:Transcript_23407/g.62542  ORF Transcript_23407/g.62542 Transcript_23407/m.62542 type:complete len:208 (-) Transcript_23407:1122-1745(-)